jgi:hypothetical protein
LSIGLVLKEWTGVMAMSDVVVSMVGSCLLLLFGIMIYRGKLTGLLAGMSLLSGERLEEAKRTAESLGANRVVGASIVFSAICLFLSSLLPDKRAILGLMVAAVIIAALAYANRGLIRMYIKVKWNPGHRNPR